MFVAFLGLHIPLIGIIVLLILNSGSSINKAAFFLLTLGLTLLATVVTLFILNALISPLKQTQRALRAYINHMDTPLLPDVFEDELGLLMHDINRLTTRHPGHAGMEKATQALAQTLAALSELSTRSAALLNGPDTAPATMAQTLNELIDHHKRQIQNCLDEINAGTVR